MPPHCYRDSRLTHGDRDKAVLLGHSRCGTEGRVICCVPAIGWNPVVPRDTKLCACCASQEPSTQNRHHLSNSGETCLLSSILEIVSTSHGYMSHVVGPANKQLINFQQVPAWPVQGSPSFKHMSRRDLLRDPLLCSPSTRDVCDATYHPDGCIPWTFALLLLL